MRLQDKASPKGRFALFAGLLCLTAWLAAAPVFGDEADEQKPGLSGLVDKKVGDSWVESLTSTSRQTSVSRSHVEKALKSILDIRIPLIDSSCDAAIAISTYRLGYAFLSGAPGAEGELRRVAQKIVAMRPGEFKGIPQKCAMEVRGFATAVMQIYLGRDWRPEDEALLRDSLNK